MRERTASEQLVPWDVFGARLVRVADHWELSGSFYSYGTSGRELAQDIRGAIEEFVGTSHSHGGEADPSTMITRMIVASWLLTKPET